MRFPKTSRNKFGAKRTGGYASRGEATCNQLLELLERAGEIDIVQRQVNVYLTRARILYIVDFLVFDKKLGEKVYVEFKGFETPEWRIKLRLWKEYGLGRLRIYRGNCLGRFTVEEIISRGESE